MSFRANNKQLLKNYNKNKIWEKVEMFLKINFESKPVYGDGNKYIKPKIKIYGDNMISNFYGKKKKKKKKNRHVDSVIKANKKYYPKALLEECKYVQEKIKTEKHIDDDLEKTESDGDSNYETESDIHNDE